MVLSVTIISVLALDLGAVRHISQKTVEGYSAQYFNKVEDQIQDGSLDIRFTAVSARLLYLNLWCGSMGSVEGGISYYVEDSEGAVVLAERSVDASEVWDEENQCLRVDLKGGEYQPGSVYRVGISFRLQEPLGIVLDGNGIMHTQKYQADYQRLLYVGLIILNLLFAAALCALLKWGLDHRLFLAMSIVVGILAVLLSPPFSQADEFRHFVRAYDLSAGGRNGYYAVPGKYSIGNIFADEEGRAQLIQIPREISDLRLVDYGENYTERSYRAECNSALCIPKLLSVFARPETKETVEVSQVATVGKGLESYWPQALAIALGRAVGVRSGLLYYLAGIGQVLVTSLMLWAALRLSGPHKNLIWLAGFVPRILLFYGSSSPDGLMMAEIVLCLGIILYLRESGVSLGQKKGAAAALAFAAVLSQICIMKLPYALPCVGGLLFLRRENFAFLPWTWVRRHRLAAGLAGGGALLLAAIYFFGIRKGDIFLHILYSFVPKEHLVYIFSHLDNIIPLFLIKGKMLLEETIGSMKGVYYIPYWLLGLAVLVAGRRQFSFKCRCYQIFLFLCMLGIVVLVGYTYTPPDYGQIWGITYRYMLPVVPMLGLALPLGTEKTEELAEQIYPPILMASVFASCLAWMTY